MLPITFSNPKDYDLIEPTDKISILGLTEFTPGKQLTVRLKKVDGKTVDLNRIPFPEETVIVDKRFD